MTNLSPNLLRDIRRYKRHKISRCYFCGWTNNTIRPLRMIQDGKLLTVSVCKPCIDKMDNQVYCIRCKEFKRGNNIQYRTVERKRLEDDTKLCLVIMPLCENCAKMWDKIKEETLDIPKEICDTCELRFSCYTGMNTEKWNRFIPSKTFKRGKKKYNMR